MATSMRDPYSVLKVPSNASQNEIKEAYRNLSKIWHPDLNPDPNAKRRFQEINEAHSILSNPKRRASYDAAPSRPTSPPISSDKSKSTSISPNAGRKASALVGTFLTGLFLVVVTQGFLQGFGGLLQGMNISTSPALPVVVSRSSPTVIVLKPTASGLVSPTYIPSLQNTPKTPTSVSIIPSTVPNKTPIPPSPIVSVYPTQSVLDTSTPIPILPSATLEEQRIVLLQNGIGLTNQWSMNNGEFQVEGYCPDKKARVDYNNWYCWRNDRWETLDVSDYSTICQRTYNVSNAFAVQGSSGSQPSYSWRCYGYTSTFRDPPQPDTKNVNCLGSPPSRLSVGDIGYVIPEYGESNLNLYPRRSGNRNQVVDIIQPNETFSIKGGPQCGDNLTWWQVSYNKNGNWGWIAEGEGNIYWLAKR